MHPYATRGWYLLTLAQLPSTNSVTKQLHCLSFCVQHLDRVLVNDLYCNMCACCDLHKRSVISNCFTQHLINETLSGPHHPKGSFKQDIRWLLMTIICLSVSHLLMSRSRRLKRTSCRQTLKGLLSSSESSSPNATELRRTPAGLWSRPATSR